MHPLVSAVLLRVARLDAFELNAESQPPTVCPALGDRAGVDSAAARRSHQD
jgi:hypothetical protein